MQLLVLILKKVDLVNDLLHELAEAKIHGGTIIDSTGMASVIENMDDLPMFGMLRRMLENDEKECSKTMFFVVTDDELLRAKKVIKKVTGDLNEPNTGILFAVPVTSVEGLGD